MANKLGAIVDVSLFTSNVLTGYHNDIVRELYQPFSWVAMIPFTINATAGTTLADENIGLFFCNG